MILLLAVVGGSVDAVMILGFNVLTGAQTGNTVLLGVAIAQRHLGAALGSTVSVASYVIGAALGEFIIVRYRETSSGPWPSAVGPVLITELILLSCLLIFWRLVSPHPVQETTCIVIAFAASAMGVQSSAMLRLHGGPTTTYITGTLTTFATEAIERLHLVAAGSASREDLTPMNGPSAVARPWMYGSTWLVYVAGVVAGGFFFLRAREMALLLPIVAIVVSIIVGIEGHDVAIELKEAPIAEANHQHKAKLV